MQTELAPIVFDDEDLQPQEVPVTYRKKQYVLTQLATGDGQKYRSAAQGSLKENPDGSISTTGAGDAELLLVTLSLKEVRFDKDGNRIGLGMIAKSFVESMPPELFMKLFDTARELNRSLNNKPTREGLQQQIERCQKLLAKLDEEDAEKKSRNGTTGNSA